MEKSLFAAMMLALAPLAAQATELAPMQAVTRDFRDGASALIYFEPGSDGYRVVATIQSDSTETMKVFRFTSVLAAGQVAEISVPGEAGTAADIVVIRRMGERVLMDDSAVALASRAP